MTNKLQENNSIASSMAKFFIGFFAGLSAISIPRLSSMLLANSQATVSFSQSFLYLIFVFAGLIGAITVILEFKIPRPPKETFFTALAVPALIAGAMNSAIETKKLESTTSQMSSLAKEVRKLNSIETNKVDSIEVIPLTEETEKPQTNGFELSFVTNAFAQESTQKVEQKAQGLSTQIDQPRFLVVLYNATSQSDAVKKAKELKTVMPGAVPIKTNGEYKVVTGKELMTEFEATQEVLTIKEKNKDIKPSLIELKK